MYKIVDGELCRVTKVDRSELELRVSNVARRVEELDNQISVLSAEKSRALDTIADIKDVIPTMFPELAKKMGFE